MLSHFRFLRCELTTQRSVQQRTRGIDRSVDRQLSVLLSRPWSLPGSPILPSRAVGLEPCALVPVASDERCVCQTSKLRRARGLINPKKRCRHLAPNSRLAESSAHELSVGRDAPTGSFLGPAKSTPAGRVSASFSATDRFVGDLNPESVIRERLDESIGTPLRDRIGLWISSAAQRDDSHADQHHGPRVDAARSILPSPIPLAGHSVASLLHERYFSAMQACERLPAATRHYLTDIYFTKVNDIVPLLEKETFLRSQVEGSASVFLERAICLVAAKHRAAGPHLRLTADGATVAPRQFCSEIYKGLLAAMDAEIEPDRLTRIRVLALMSLHCEGYEGAEAASMHLCQAIHQSQTIGLHLDRPGRTSTDPHTKLFWCLWTLDKMHACIGGRPVLLADRDIGIEKPNFNDRQSRGAFAVWLAISDLLATVISFYRPSADTTTSGWEEGFPAFEDIVGESTQEDLDFATLGAFHPHAIWASPPHIQPELKSAQASWNFTIMPLPSCHAGIRSPNTSIAPSSHPFGRDLRPSGFTPLSHLNALTNCPLFPLCRTRSLYQWVSLTVSCVRVS